jgi:hypothetical protein
MKKCILVIGILLMAGCASEVKWKSAGTLVSVSPHEESSRLPGRLGTAVGDTELSRTRVETTTGVYIVIDKVSVAQEGAPVKVGYSEKNGSDKPSHLAFGGRKYEIAD